MGPTARVAVSSDFLGAFAELPPAIQSKVSRFLALFQRDPTGPGINYERINVARNLNMRSVRIDDAWRGIVAGFHRHGTGQVGEGGGTETDLRCDG